MILIKKKETLTEIRALSFDFVCKDTNYFQMQVSFRK